MSADQTEKQTKKDLSQQLSEEKEAREALEKRLARLEGGGETKGSIVNEDGASRVFKGEQSVHSDRHKLEIAYVRKNFSWDPKAPNVVQYEHVHFFHSYDSSGRAQRWCHPSAGHIHEIKWEVIDGSPKITYVGPPMLAASSKTGRKYPYDRKGLLIVNHDDPNDNGDRHTHKSTYEESENINLRRAVPKAQQIVAATLSEEEQAFRAFKSAGGVAERD